MGDSMCFDEDWGARNYPLQVVRRWLRFVDSKWTEDGLLFGWNGPTLEGGYFRTSEMVQIPSFSSSSFPKKTFTIFFKAPSGLAQNL